VILLGLGSGRSALVVAVVHIHMLLFTLIVRQSCTSSDYRSPGEVQPCPLGSMMESANPGVFLVLNTCRFIMEA
jgi:hypothetical protein